MGVINFRNHPMYVSFQIFGSKLRHILRDFEEKNEMHPQWQRSQPNESQQTYSTKKPYFSLRGPAKALHQRAPKARVVRMGGRVDGWTDGRMDGDQKGRSIFLIFKYVNK